MGSDHLVWAWGEPLESIRRNFTLGREGRVRLRASTALGEAPPWPGPRQLLLAGQAVGLSMYRGGWGPSAPLKPGPALRTPGDLSGHSDLCQQPQTI